MSKVKGSGSLRCCKVMKDEEFDKDNNAAVGVSWLCVGKVKG